MEALVQKNLCKFSMCQGFFRGAMKTIWKYALESLRPQEITLRKNAEILSAQFQNEKLCLWVLLDTGEIEETYRIHIIGTGFNINVKLDYYIGTVQQDPYVWHVFAEVL